MKPRNFAGLVDAFVVAYAREHDIEVALRFCFALDDYARGSAERLRFDATALGAAIAQRRGPSGPSTDDLQAEIAAVAKQHGFTADQLLGSAKVPAVVAARRHAITILRQRYSIGQVAAALGISRCAVSAGAKAWGLRTSKAEGGGARLTELATVDPCEGSEAAPAGGGGEMQGLAAVPRAGRLAAGGLSASPAKLSRRAA